jgi:phosphate transport system substrate-binding protein
MRKSEWDLCAQNGVTDITEALIGYDGLSIAISRANEQLTNLTLEQVYLALGRQGSGGRRVGRQPLPAWSEIDPSLPDSPILAYGPPPTSGTRDAFVELAMWPGCEELQFVVDGGFDGDWVEENCSRMRQDGPFVEAGENDNLIVQRLQADPNAVGIFGYSFLYENLDKLRGVAINGVEANSETIASFDYPIARPLYFYVKNAHRGVIPGLNEFIAEYASDNALGDGGYLQERGLVVLADDVRDRSGRPSDQRGQHGAGHGVIRSARLPGSGRAAPLPPALEVAMTLIAFALLFAAVLGGYLFNRMTAERIRKAAARTCIR